MGRLFETSNESTILIGHLSSFGRSENFIKIYPTFFYFDFMSIYIEHIFCESCTPANYKTQNDYFKVNLLRSVKDFSTLILEPELFGVKYLLCSIGLIF